MADHRWVGLAVLDAARDAANRWIFPELLQEGLQPWGGVKMVCISGSPRTDHGVDVTDFLDKGIASFPWRPPFLGFLILFSGLFLGPAIRVKGVKQ